MSPNAPLISFSVSDRLKETRPPLAFSKVPLASVRSCILAISSRIPQRLSITANLPSCRYSRTQAFQAFCLRSASISEGEDLLINPKCVPLCGRYRIELPFYILLYVPFAVPRATIGYLSGVALGAMHPRKWAKVWRKGQLPRSGKLLQTASRGALSQMS